MNDPSRFSEEQSEGLDIKSQVRLEEGLFMESCCPNIENTLSKTVKHRGQELLTETVDAADQVGAQTRVEARA